MSCRINIAKVINHTKTLAIGAGVFLLLGLLLFFGFRNIALRKVIHVAMQKLYESHNMQLTYSHAKFSGFTTASVTNITLTNLQNDTLLSIANVQAKPDWWDLMMGEKNLNLLLISDLKLFINQTGVADDTSASVEIRDSNAASSTLKPHVFLSKMLNQVFDAIPDKLLIDSSTIYLATPTFVQAIIINHIQLLSNVLQGSITTLDNSTKENWNISGMLLPHKREAQISLSATDLQRVKMLYINQKWNALVAFNQLQMRIKNINWQKDMLSLHAELQLDDLLINHAKISSKDVFLTSLDMKLDMHFSDGTFVLDSSSVIVIDSLLVNAYATIESTDKDTAIAMQINIPRTQTNNFINALPDGLFSHIKGMDIAGEFDYTFFFKYSEKDPENTQFETRLNKYNFAIRKYGQADIAKLNQTFIYTPIEHGKPMRDRVIGIDYPYYTPLNQIPDMMVKSVLICEDPSFFNHRGFIDEAFKQSIVKNIRTRKFARGASTISMQLVKNAFLTREKTLSRKLEEILLVYIIEHNRLISKERMMEVYLNIIEWGPNVYGIGEASAFYFNKKPAQLNLSECLFLATIIPRPKGFMWRFDKDGNQLEFVEKQYSHLVSLMIKRGFITEQDTIGLKYKVPVTGAAKSFIKTAIPVHIEFDEDGLPIFNNYDDET
jgi:hypothetical protein